MESSKEDSDKRILRNRTKNTMKSNNEDYEIDQTKSEFEQRKL